MSEIMPNEEFIKRNYDKTIELIKKVYKTDDTNFGIPLLEMIEKLGDRYALCPASSHKDYYSAFPGGLAYHNLHVLQWLGRFANLVLPKENLTESLLKLAILHNIGKIGDLNQDFYLPTKEDWKIKNGTLYDINPDIQYMKITERSIFLVNHFGISLTQDEHIAILLSEVRYEDSNSYKFKEPKLALLLQTAVTWATKLEKENTVLWP